MTTVEARRCVRAGLFRQEELRDADFAREALLGHGSYAVVIAATHVPSQQRVALKQISRHRLRALGLERQLRWEINVQRTLRHPNVVRLLSYYVTPRHITLVLEYCAGGTLAQRVRGARHGCLRESTAARYARHVARALHYLHEHHIVHRDLKLENVLLDGRDVARLADFGWSRKLDGDDDDDAATAAHSDGSDGDDADGVSATRPRHDNHGNDSDAVATSAARSCRRPRRTVCGTLDYLSPEMVDGKPHTARTDVWSLGVMIAEMVTGTPPFYRDTQQATLEAIRSAAPTLTRVVPLSQQPVAHGDGDGGGGEAKRDACAAATVASPSSPLSPWRELSPSLRELLTAMLCKDAERRPTMANVLAHPWLQKPQASDAPATPSSAPSRKRPCNT